MPTGIKRSQSAPSVMTGQKNFSQNLPPLNLPKREEAISSIEQASNNRKDALLISGNIVSFLSGMIISVVAILAIAAIATTPVGWAIIGGILAIATLAVIISAVSAYQLGGKEKFKLTFYHCLSGFLSTTPLGIIPLLISMEYGISVLNA